MASIGPNITDIQVPVVFKPIVKPQQISAINGVNESDEDENIVDMVPDMTTLAPMIRPQLSSNLENDSKIRFGKYKLSKPADASRAHFCNYVYVPQAALKNPQFEFGEIFKSLGLSVPAMIFRLNVAGDSVDWNVRLPLSRRDLTEPDSTKSSPYGKLARGSAMRQSSQRKNQSGPLIHYQGVLRENCKRLLRGTYAACAQAGAIFRIDEMWSDEYPKDYVADWISGSDNAVLLGLAMIGDFHPDVWSRLDAGAKAIQIDAETPLPLTEDDEITIDPTPFYDKTIVLPRRPLSGHRYHSIPHPNLTHLIISDNQHLLEKRLNEYVPWGLILVNGDKSASKAVVDAIQNSRPLICLKYTGGAADMACEMHESINYFLQAKKKNPLVIPDKPFPDDMIENFHHDGWMRRFDTNEIRQCELMNVLIENWPDRFNAASVFMVDMFATTEDEVQDRITLTMGVVNEAAHELGGSVSEHRRLTYAWRTRHKFIYNARIYRFKSDLLIGLITFFTMLSTISAVVYTHFQISPEMLFKQHEKILFWLLKANLMLPLIATIIKGVFASMNPQVKHIALRHAAVKIESEIYMYRAKIGRYSMRKKASDDNEGEPKKSNKTDNKNNKDDSNKDASNKTTVADKRNPRRTFATALDAIWLDLAASDIQNGSLQIPMDTSMALYDINKRIRSNRQEQDAYFIALKGRNIEKDKNKINGVSNRETEKKNLTLLASSQKRSRTLQQNFIAWLCCCCFAVSSSYAKISTELPFFREIPRDDGLFALTADDYLKIRLVPMIGKYANAAPGQATSNIITTVLCVVLSVAASALSTFGLSVYIPAALALSGAITGWMNYQQMELKLMQTNSALHRLHQLLVWWDSLTMIEKRNTNHKETLVKITEACIESQATIFSGGSSNRTNNDDDDDDE